MLVQASLWEGMPNAVLEAMAARRPVVGTAVEGTEDLVVPGQTGWLVPPRDPAALGQALDEAADDPERCRRYGEAGRLRVEHEFSIDVTVAAYERLWAAVLGYRLGSSQWAVGSGQYAVGVESRSGSQLRAASATAQAFLSSQLTTAHCLLPQAFPIVRAVAIARRSTVLGYFRKMREIAFVQLLRMECAHRLGADRLVECPGERGRQGHSPLGVDDPIPRADQRDPEQGPSLGRDRPTRGRIASPPAGDARSTGHRSRGSTRRSDRPAR